MGFMRVESSLPVNNGSQIVLLLSRYNARDKRQQFLDRLEVGRLHRVEVFDPPAEVPLLYRRIPVQLDDKSAITRQRRFAPVHNTGFINC
jgi:hypothetical protein